MHLIFSTEFKYKNSAFHLQITVSYDFAPSRPEEMEEKKKDFLNPSFNERYNSSLEISHKNTSFYSFFRPLKKRKEKNKKKTKKKHQVAETHFVLNCNVAVSYISRMQFFVRKAYVEIFNFNHLSPNYSN